MINYDRIFDFGVFCVLSLFFFLHFVFISLSLNSFLSPFLCFVKVNFIARDYFKNSMGINFCLFSVYFKYLCHGLFLSSCFSVPFLKFMKLFFYFRMNSGSLYVSFLHSHFSLSVPCSYSYRSLSQHYCSILGRTSRTA